MTPSKVPQPLASLSGHGLELLTNLTPLLQAVDYRFDSGSDLRQGRGMIQTKIG
jgi:hypothetical protein